MEHNPGERLGEYSRSRALQGFTPSETATFIFSMKEPLFTLLREEGNPKRLADHIWTVTELLDKLDLSGRTQRGLADGPARPLEINLPRRALTRGPSSRACAISLLVRAKVSWSGFPAPPKRSGKKRR